MAGIAIIIGIVGECISLLRSAVAASKWLLKKIRGKNHSKVNFTKFEIHLDEDMRVTGGSEKLELLIDQLIEEIKQDRQYSIEFIVDGYEEIKKEVAKLEKSRKPKLKTQLVEKRERIRSHYDIWGQSVEMLLNESLELIIRKLFLDNKYKFLLRVDEIASCASACFPLFSPNRMKFNDGKRFDVFTLDDRWSFRIKLGEEEVNRLVDKFEVDGYSRLTRLFNLSTFDLHRETLVDTVIPEMIWEYIRLKYNQQAPDDKYFNLMSYHIGVA
ncbi:MAG: hypothetical protein JW712_04570 [Dehalococcoidales bacterium]|nr:hypothetical protein [Dehalococcoidales bacterium]